MWFFFNLGIGGYKRDHESVNVYLKRNEFESSDNNHKEH